MEKRIFGIVLTLVGIGGLIYAAISITQKSSSYTNILVYGILGLIFFLPASVFYATPTIKPVSKIEFYIFRIHANLNVLVIKCKTFLYSLFFFADLFFYLK